MVSKKEVMLKGVSKNVVVVSAHPDDEVLGAGGALIRHRNAGDNLYWIIITNISEDQGFPQEQVRKRQMEIDEVAKRLKIERVFKLDFPTMKLSTSSLIEMVPAISAIFNEIQPNLIYCLNRSDIHSDHRIVFQATMACTKSFRYPSIHTVLMYECISETEFAAPLAENAFMPSYFVDISDHIDEKLELLSIYESEFGQHPFPRSIENVKALAHFRGASCGVRYAEAFQLLKHIEK